MQIIRNYGGHLLEQFLDILTDALVDSLKMLPFLFGAYLLMEWLEHRSGEGMEALLAKARRLGPFTGALLGCVPQCGFSVAAANLYAGRVITMGTLVAVFLSTSDEAVPLLLASPEHWRQMIGLLAIKLIVALAAGFLLDFVCKGILPHAMRGGYAGSAADVDCHEHEDEDGVWKAALKHTLHIFLYILLFNGALGLLTAWVGEDAIAAFLVAAGSWQPFAAAVIGLIPNCVSSVLITQLYMAGTLSLGGAVAGLSTGAGVGLAVLVRANRKRKQNALIVLLLYAIGVLAGVVTNWVV